MSQYECSHRWFYSLSQAVGSESILVQRDCSSCRESEEFEISMAEAAEALWTREEGTAYTMEAK